MWKFLREIGEAIWAGIKGLWTSAVKIVKAVIDFTREIFDLMFGVLSDLLDGLTPKSIEESPIKPFVADMGKLIDEAPVSDQGLFAKFQQKKNNLMSGYYDTRTGEIKKPTYAAADTFTDMDKDIKDNLNNDGIVIIG